MCSFSTLKPTTHFKHDCSEDVSSGRAGADPSLVEILIASSTALEKLCYVK